MFHMTVTLYYLGECVLGESVGGGELLVISTAECVVETFDGFDVILTKCFWSRCFVS